MTSKPVPLSVFPTQQFIRHSRLLCVLIFLCKMSEEIVPLFSLFIFLVRRGVGRTEIADL